MIPGKGDCGAIYDVHAPLFNACKAPEEWQIYDILFRAPRADDSGSIVEDARITVFQNNILIHNNITLSAPTGGSLDQNITDPGPLLLQDHGDLVSFRNIWIAHLPSKGSETYEPQAE